MSGKLNMNDLAAQARSAADQLRAARKDLGDEAGWMVDSYLGILDHFLNQIGPASGSSTNPPSRKAQRKATLEEE